MAGADLVELPVHPGGPGVEDLHAVHADVADAALRIDGVDVGEGDEGAAVVRPAFQHRQRVQAGPAGLGLVDDFLAGAGADLGRLGVEEEVEAGADQVPALGERLGRLGLEQEGDLVDDVLEVLDAEGEVHPALGAEAVDEDGELRDGAVGEERLLDQERLAAARRFHLPVGEGGDLQVHLGGRGDAGQLARLLQRRDELAGRFVGHYFTGVASWMPHSRLRPPKRVSSSVRSSVSLRVEWVSPIET